MTVKRITKTVFIGVVLLPLVLVGTVFSQEQSEESDRQQRINERKEALQIQLNEVAQRRVRARCRASQAQLRRVELRVAGVSARRERIYNTLTERLASLSEKLQVQGIDTTEYDEQINELNAKIEAFYLNLAQYETVVSDLASMDCAADPEGYRASLEEARTLRARSVQTAQEIRTYLQETIRTTLQSVRGQLESGENRGQSDE